MKKAFTLKFSKDSKNKPQTTTVIANNNHIGGATSRNNTKKYQAPQKPTTSTTLGISVDKHSKTTKNTTATATKVNKEIKINIGISTTTTTKTTAAPNNNLNNLKQQPGKIQKTDAKSKASGTKNKHVEKRFTPLFSNLSPSVAFKSVKDLKWTKPRVLLFLLLFVLFILQIVSTSTASWITFGDAFQTHGLWRVCRQIDFDTGSALDCERFTMIPDYMKQMQAFTVVGILITFFCLIYFVIWLKGSCCPLLVLPVLVEVVVTASIYTDKNFCMVARSKLGTFGWCYYLTWGTSLVAAGTGILATRL